MEEEIKVEYSKQDLADFLIGEFEAVFERKPRPDDHLLTYRYLRTPRDMEREIKKILGDSDIEPKIQYAYYKVGFLVSEYNIDFIPKERLDAWNSAIEEFEEINISGKVLMDESSSKWYQFTEEINSLIISLGYVSDRGFPDSSQHTQISSKYFTYQEFMAYCCIRAMKVLKSIMWLLEKDVGEEAISLIRNVYEIYSTMVYTKKHPESISYIVDATIGLDMGTHRYKRSKGKTKRNFIINKASGEVFKGTTKTQEMIDASDFSEDIELRGAFYKYLSEFVHPSSINMDSILDIVGEGIGFTPNKHEHVNEACLHAISTGSWIVDFVSKFDFIVPDVRKDLITVVDRIKQKTLYLIENDIPDWENKNLYKLLHNRTLRLG